MLIKNLELKKIFFIRICIKFGNELVLVKIFSIIVDKNLELKKKRVLVYVLNLIMS